MKLRMIKWLKYSILLICFHLSIITVSGQSVERLKSIFQHSYGQWLLSDSVRLFNTENLYDYIDGGADVYLSYSFQELLVATYNGKDGNYITAEIYQHQSPMTAFGIYAQERPFKEKFIKIGAQGYQEPGILNFLCDRYYVKISSHDESPATALVIHKLAADLASKLDANAQMPKDLAYLPSENKLENSENLINTNFLGYDFFRSVIVANYEMGDGSFKLFVIPTQSFENAKSVMTKYMDVVKSPFNGTEGRYTVTDPHNGKIMLEWKGRFIWGIVNDMDTKTSTDCLKFVRDRLVGAKEI